jgi:PPOX class probable FMN-dependent enzyme
MAPEIPLAQWTTHLTGIVEDLTVLDDVVRDPDALKALYGPVPKRAAGKVHQHFDENDRSFIASSPFMVLATVQADGLLDVSPRGDHPGFVTVLDGDRLVLPDRPGNNRIDSLLNVLSDPRASMIFLVPGVGQTLRVNGTASVSTDPGLLKLGAVGDRLPATALVLAAAEILYQCPRALVRSRLWDPAARVAADRVPDLDAVLAAQVPGLSLAESRAIGAASVDDPLW